MASDSLRERDVAGGNCGNTCCSFVAYVLIGFFFPLN